jgi:xanthine dehydrogenase molybdopterin-binding subunit B
MRGAVVSKETPRKVSEKQSPTLIDVCCFFHESNLFFSVNVTGLIPKKGDHVKGLGAAPLRASGKVRCGSQQHFYMEPQTALAIPDEDKFMTVYSSCQVGTCSLFPLRSLFCLRFCLRVLLAGSAFGLFFLC